MKKTITACACLCMAALPGYVSAADQFVIDQNQPLSSVLLARLSQPDLWQTFEQSSNVISGAGVFLYPGEGERGTVRIELWDGPPKATGGMKGERVAFADA